MSASRTKFYLDKQNAKWLGVCSGIADYTGIDVTWVRVGMVLLSFPTHFFLLVAYLVIAWIAQPKPLAQGNSVIQLDFAVIDDMPFIAPSSYVARDMLLEAQQPPMAGAHGNQFLGRRLVARARQRLVGVEQVFHLREHQRITVHTTDRVHCLFEQAATQVGTEGADDKRLDTLACSLGKKRVPCAHCVEPEQQGEKLCRCRTGEPDQLFGASPIFGAEAVEQASGIAQGIGSAQGSGLSIGRIARRAVLVAGFL